MSDGFDRKKLRNVQTRDFMTFKHDNHKEVCLASQSLFTPNAEQKDEKFRHGLSVICYNVRVDLIAPCGAADGKR